MRLKAISQKKLSVYRPYTEQSEFHALGKTKRERAIFALNQGGKTLCGGSEASMHLTGDYADWWVGRRWSRPVKAWVASNSNETTRDNPQKMLMGDEGSWGTGQIPFSAIEGEPKMSRGFAGLIDRVKIKHKSGGYSQLQFKAYEQGRQKWQGATLDFIWCDEEPPPDVYSEALARLTATGGMMYLTMTPLLGMSEVAEKFFPEPDNPDRGFVLMGIKAARHIDVDERDTIINSYPEHERLARTEGIPMLGSGRVFPVAKQAVEVESFPIPDHFAILGGIDFGYGDHPFAAVRIAWDRDADCVYLTHCYKEKQITPSLHVSSLRPWGTGFQYACPHDAGRGFGDQGPIADIYRKEGLDVMKTHATISNTERVGRAAAKISSFAPEAMAQVVLERMQTSRFKAFKHLGPWWEEFATYHRKEGKLVQRKDDLISALFKAVMMLRKARVPAGYVNYSADVVSEFNPFDRGSYR